MSDITMSGAGIIAGLLGLAFFASSICHALFNAVYEKEGPAHLTLLHLHYTVLYCFTIATIVYGWRWHATYVSALALVGPFWIALHVLRALLDWMDGRGSRRRDVVARHWNDALANIVTMVFVLSVAAAHDPWLIWVALALSVGMWGKEFLFRSYTDIFERIKGKRKTAQQGPGRASPHQFVVAHGLANTVKSLSYMILGFALCYRCLAELRPEYVPLIFTSAANVDDFDRALGFTVRNFSLTAAGETDKLLFAILGLEGLCAILIGISFNAVPFKRN